MGDIIEFKKNNNKNNKILKICIMCTLNKSCPNIIYGRCPLKEEWIKKYGYIYS